MNTLTIGIAALGFLGLGYVFYGALIEKLYGVDPSRKTPAEEFYDGVDFVPARNWFVLFGHHFASIAGAAPIIGPIIAVSVWGWGPSLVWVVLGCVLMGGVHDFDALMASVRNNGSSIAEIGIRFLYHQVKGIITASFQIEISPVFVRVKVFQEKLKISSALGIILV